jgi:L-fuculose-phosphate aldolase
VTHTEQDSIDDIRTRIVALAQRLIPDGLVQGTSGNISARVGDLVAITPTSIPYDRLTPDMISVVGLDGTIVDATHHPSAEVPMHLAAYRSGDVGGVVHTHSPYASVLSTVVDELPSIHYMLATLGGPVRVTPFVTYGTPELGAVVAEALEGRSAAILGNHGTLTVGPTVEHAYFRAITLEWLSALYYRARMLGEPRLLTDEQMGLVNDRMRVDGYAGTA